MEKTGFFKNFARALIFLRQKTILRADSDPKMSRTTPG
jgi:hypothetical protein